MKQEDVRCPEKIAWSISFEKFWADRNLALLPARRGNLSSMQFGACMCIRIFGNINMSMRFVQGGGAYSGLPNNSCITMVVKLCFSQIRYVSLSYYTTTAFNTTLGNTRALSSTLQLPLFLTTVLFGACFWMLSIIHKYKYYLIWIFKTKSKAKILTHKVFFKKKHQTKNQTREGHGNLLLVSLQSHIKLQLM